jgi:hypothetical protein
MRATIRSRVERRQARDAVVDPGQGTFDRDVDSQPGRPPRVPIESLPEYQRIVVNPFLGVLTWLVMFALIRAGVRSQSSTLFLIGLSLLFVAFVFLQFHCLDCGATGWLFRYRRHACPSVVARYQNREVGRFRVPNVKIQMTIWFYLLAGALFLLVLFLSAPR